MEFSYNECEQNVYRPYLPIIFSYAGKNTPLTGALVDTGSDFTILPLEIAHYLEIELDDSKTIKLDSAGGGIFTALPSQKEVLYTIPAKKGYRPITWSGVIYFTEEEKIVLLGHRQCLEKFDLTFYGPERKLAIVPRFTI